MFKEFAKRASGVLLTGMLAFASIAAAPTPAAAATFSGPITILLNGNCTTGSSTIMNQTIVVGASEFTTTDRVVTFPDGSMLAQDDFAIYLVDSAGIIVGATGNGIQPSTALSAMGFPLVAQMPLTAPGNVTAYLIDELDTFPDQTLGATFVNPGAAVKGSNSFNLVAIEPDCAFIPADSTPPTVTSITRQTPSSTPTNADSLTFRVIFDGAVSNVGTADFQATGTTAPVSGVTGGGNTYDVTVSGGDLANLDGTVGLSFAAGQDIADAVGNALTNTAPTGANETFEVDNTAPFVTDIVRNTPSDEVTNADSLIFRVVFDTRAQNVTANDFQPTGTTATAASVQDIGNGIFDVTVSGGDLASLNGTVGLTLASGQDISDTAGNVVPIAAPTINNQTYTLDNVGPSLLSIERNGGSPTANDTLMFDVTFDQALDAATVNAADFDVSGTTATVTGVSVVGANVSVTVSGGDLAGLTGTVGLALAAGQDIMDAAGNSLASTAPSGANETFELDNTAPTVTLSTTLTDPINAVSVPINVVFSENVATVVTGNFDTTNANVTGVTGSGANYVVTVEPIADGPFSVQFLAGSVQDGVGNDNVASNTLNLTSDQSAPVPTLTITPMTQTNVSPIPFTLVFNEAVLGTLTTGSFDVTNGTVSSFSGSGMTFNGTVTPSGQGPVTITLPVGTASDAAGNTNTVVGTDTINFDDVSPTVTITGTPDFPGVPYTVTFTFSEAVTGFDIANLVTTNVTVTGQAGSGTTYTATATATDFAHSIQVPAGTATDVANNTNDISNLFANVVDGTSPTLAITGLPENYDPGDVFNITLTFSENVVGFEASDISVTGGALSNFAGGPAAFTATITPGGTEDVVVSVADGAATDVSGQASLGASATSALNSADIASEMISEFLEARARNLIQSQPNLTNLLRGGAPRGFSGAATRGRAAFDMAFGGGDSPFWGEVTYSRTEEDSGDETIYGLGTIGGHYTYSENLIVGAMVQFDYAETDFADGTDVSGSGWLVGPYFAARLPDHPLYFEGRLLWGETNNSITPVGTFTDDFTGERWLATFGITGEFETERLTILPNINFAHVEERQNAYIDGLSNLVPAQTIALTELSLGIDFEAPIEVRDGSAMFSWGLTGIWSNLEGSGAAAAFVSDVSETRGRLDLGYWFNGDNGVSANAGLYVDGLGANFQTIGLETGVELEF